MTANYINVLNYLNFKVNQVEKEILKNKVNENIKKNLLIKKAVLIDLRNGYINTFNNDLFNENMLELYATNNYLYHVQEIKIKYGTYYIIIKQDQNTKVYKSIYAFTLYKYKYSNTSLYYFYTDSFIESDTEAINSLLSLIFKNKNIDNNNIDKFETYVTNISDFMKHHEEIKKYTKRG